MKPSSARIHVRPQLLVTDERPRIVVKPASCDDLGWEQAKPHFINKAAFLAHWQRRHEAVPATTARNWWWPRLTDWLRRLGL